MGRSMRKLRGHLFQNFLPFYESREELEHSLQRFDEVLRAPPPAPPAPHSQTQIIKSPVWSEPSDLSVTAALMW